MTKIKISYFAALRDATGSSEETYESAGQTIRDVFEELTAKYEWNFSEKDIRAALNDRFAKMETPISDGDKIVFIPPVAGG